MITSVAVALCDFSCRLQAHAITRRHIPTQSRQVWRITAQLAGQTVPTPTLTSTHGPFPSSHKMLCSATYAEYISAWLPAFAGLRVICMPTE